MLKRSKSPCLHQHRPEHIVEQLVDVPSLCSKARLFDLVSPSQRMRKKKQTGTPDCVGPLCGPSALQLLLRPASASHPTVLWMCARSSHVSFRRQLFCSATKYGFSCRQNCPFLTVRYHPSICALPRILTSIPPTWPGAPALDRRRFTTPAGDK